MKSKCSFILKASTALVLALLMLFGTVTTSVAAVVDNAKNTAEADADTSTEAHGAEGFFATLRKNISNLADTGKKADLAETGATTIYFDDTNTKWGSVYVWSSSSSYWDNSNGSGSSGRTLTKMSKVSGTSNLYSASLSSTGAYVAFVKDNQANYGNFYNTKAAYRGDFATTKPVYIPYSTSSGTYNGTSYYSNGEWTYAPVTYSEDAVVYYKMGSWWTNTTCYEYVGLTTFGASTSMVPAYNLTTYLNGSNATNGNKSTAGSATTTTYFATIPAGTYYHTWFERKKSDSASAGSYNATSKTAALSTSKNTNTTALTADSTQVTLNSTTSNAPIITETASSTSVNAGVEVTLGASMTKNADLNVLDSVTYAVTSSNSSTATITGNKFTATAGGTYTVTATGTYHAKGYSSLSGTVTDTVDITVTVPAHSVTRTAPTNGTLQLSADGTTWGTSTLTIAEGANYYVKVTPNTGYKVSALTVGGSAVAAAAGSTTAYTYTGTMGTSDVATSATFAIRTFNVKKTESGASGGTVKVGNTTIGTTNTSVNYGTNYTVTVTAPSGYNIKTVTGVSGTTTGLNTSSVSITGVTINADKTIAVTYESAGTCGLTLSPTSASLYIGQTQSITVTPNSFHDGGTISATSGNTSIATVSGSGTSFTVTAVAAGTTTITVNCTEGGSATFSVTVNSPSISAFSYSTNINIGESSSAPTITTTNPSNSSSLPSGWSISYAITSGSDKATINSSTGVVTGKNYGSVTVTATLKKGSTSMATKTATLTVNTPVITFNNYADIDVGGTSVAGGASCTNATNLTPTYTINAGSTYASIANESTGTVTGKQPGTATVTVSYKYNGTTIVSKDASITVTAPTVTLTAGSTLAIGDTITLNATSTGATTNPTWTYSITSGSSCATLSGTTLTGTAAGTVKVKATANYGNGYTLDTAESTFTIETPSLTIKDGSTSVINGTVYTTKDTNKTLTVGTNFSDPLTAKSSNTSIATVSLDGTTLTITPKAKGTCKVSVSTNSGYAPTGVNLTETAAAMPQGFIRRITELAATAAVAEQTKTFTVNVAEADTYKYVYFTNGCGISTPKAYLFGDGQNAAYPGETMVKIGKNESNQDVYAIRYLATKNYTKVIISNGNSGDADKVWITVNNNKVSDIPLSSTQNAIWCNTLGKDNANAGRWNCTIVKPQITANNVTIDMGGTKTMTATVLTSGTPSSFDWSSGTASVATTADTHTDSNVITGVAPGTSTITIKAYAEKPSGWNSIVTDGTADNYVAGTTTATATVVAENKTVTFGAKKTDNGSDFTDLSGAVTAKYYDEDTSSGTGSSGSGSSGSGSEAEPAGGPYYLHIGKQNGFITNTAIKFTWNGSYYYASYNVDTANADYPFVINTKNTPLDDSDKSSSSQSVTVLASDKNPDNISFNYCDRQDYGGFDCFKIVLPSATTFYITFTPSDGVVFRSSVSSGSGSSGSGSGGGESGSGTGYTGEGTAMTSPQSVPYGKVAVFTAQATYTSGTDTYAFAEWVDGSNNTLSKNTEYVVKITEAKTVYARYYKVFKLSAFDSYTKNGSTVTFVTAPPKKITIKHGSDTYVYDYDGTALPGNPDSPDAGITKPQALPVASGGTYGQGNYIQYYAGDEITLTYSAMASSEILKGVFYDNSKDFYVAKPTSGQFVAHSHPTTPAIYMNGAYYTPTQLNNRTFTGVTADNDAHSIKFTGTQDYKNIDVEIGTKRKVYFSDYTNAIIGSKNTDDYYADDEALSETTGTNPKKLTVKAAKSATQTNTITASNIRFYKANADGTKGEEVSRDTLGITISGTSSTSSSSSDGAELVFNGNMPAYDLYIDLNMQNSYTLKLGTKIVSDLGGSKTRLQQAATTISIAGSTTLNANTSGYVTSGTTSVNTGTTATLSVTGLASGYMFVGWYWGDDTAPDYEKGYISDKATLSYAPKKGGTIWAVGTKDLFINGSKYITGKDTDWNVVNNVAQNLQMSFDAKSGRYYWEITDTMYNTVSSTGFNYNSSYAPTTKSGDYYYFNTETDFGNSFFQFFDTATGDTRTIWSLPGTEGVTFYTQNSNGVDFGKARQTHDTENGHHNKYEPVNALGWIKFKESDSPGYSSPLRIYYDPDSPGYFTVEATAIYSDIYVSNGYSVGSTLKTDAVTVQPVVDGVVKTSGQTGYFAINPQGSGWDPDHEGHVSHYIPQKKGATVRITKKAGGSDKIAAFLIYDIDNKTVRAEKNITKGTTANSKTPYYIDLTLANERQNLYIVPIVEEADAKVTITFDATQLNRAQWGDIVTAYSWYQGSNNDGLGEYPGQPMIPSDDMSTWTTSFPTTKGGKELAGITFTNYVDGIHSWLGCSGVMGEASDHKTGTATGGIINVYNHVYSGDTGEYSRTNYKAQTYDYHEPIALYDRYKNEDSVNITFQMKDGNSTLISWYHKDLVNTSNNILNPSQEKWRLNFEYLTNAKGDQYIDMNGNPLGANNKPTATFYVASKGLAVYKNSTMKYIFDSGQNYEMQGYEAKYTRGTGDRGYYTRQNGGWSSAITYGGVTGLDMKYAVQWYVYDAQGNYITTVLSAGIADLSSNNTDTYIAKQLEDLGYAVDGKSVAICYDKPRYMYGDWDGVTDSADNINSGPNFDAYRFEGQWIAAAQTDTVKVNVGVGMMTDSGEVLADSNTAAYGNATASLRSGITFGKQNYATVANDGSWAQTAATDAKLNGIVLNASKQNFIGWYYYDANTGDFVKANYASNDDFYPNYSNKDVTFYAMYKASAVYNYIYRGRESSDDISTWKVYSAAGNALTSEEMANQNKVVYDNHSDDVIAKLPVGIGVFKKNIDFSASNANSWDKDNNTQYTLKLSGFEVTLPTYTLTAHYKNAKGELVTIEDSAVYNGKAVNLTTGAYTDSKGASKPAGTPVTSYKPGFTGWYEYNPKDGNIGELLSTQANYGMRLTKNQHIIAVYKDDNITLPTDGWKAYIDENEVNKELTTKDTGVFYNDTIVRVRNGSDVKATLPGDAKIGVIVVCDNKTNKTINGYSDTQLNTLVTKVASGKTMKTASGLSITNMQATTQTSFNRTDIAVRADYAKTLGAKYCVYAYIYDGSTYHFSAASDVKTYE